MEINESCFPPGFRFHPTEEELVGYYLRRKINSLKIDLDVIVDIDLYRIEPWDIQDKCKLGYDEQNEWYFFSHKDKKYPTGTRTNRATTAGFWKATGRDKAVLSKNKIIGMRKTLVFYKGRAPNGKKSDWIMHEYRLQTSQHAPNQEEGWVVCRAFKKPSPSTQNRPYGYDPCWQNQNPNYYHHLQMMRNNPMPSISTHTAGSPSSLPDLMSPNSITIESSYGQPPTAMTPYNHHHHQLPPFDFDQQVNHNVSLNHLLESPNNQEGFVTCQNREDQHNQLYDEYRNNNNWKFLDSLLSIDQAPSSSNNPSSQLNPLDDHDQTYQVLNPSSNQLNDDQVGDFLTCFTNL